MSDGEQAQFLIRLLDKGDWFRYFIYSRNNCPKLERPTNAARRRRNDQKDPRVGQEVPDD